MIMKKKLLTILVIASVNLLFGQNNWHQQVSGVSYHLKDITFVDYKTGWAVGEYGTIVHTQDGGYHWSSQTSVITTDFNAVYFTDELNGWAVGNSSKIIHTTDGGTNWIDASFGTGTLNDVFFTHQDTGFIVGANGIFRYTNDGGATWTEDNEPSLLTINACYFVDGNTGYVATTSGRVQKTTNGGLNWTLLTTGTTWTLFGITMKNDVIYAVGDYGTIIKSDNFGSSWSVQSSGTTEMLIDVAFADNQTGWIVGDLGLILFTQNGGTNWNNDISNTTNPLYGISLINDNLVWAVGADGKIIKKDFAEKICLVMVDSAINKNKIVWERIPDQGTAYYNVYKLAGASYDSIGFVLYDDMSEFTDFASTPDQNADRYKITAVDSSGNESALSPYHQTINLSSLQGVPATTITLMWNHFEDESGEFSPSYYYIYRGTTPNNLVLYDSLSIAFNTKDYPNQTVWYYYIVTVKKPGACIPSSSAKANGGPYSQSTSNMEDDGVCNPIGINNLLGYIPLSIYPNPATENIIIQFNNPENKQYELKITDVTGKTIISTSLRGGTTKQSVDVLNYDSGMYFVEIKGDKVFKGRFVVE